MTTKIAFALCCAVALGANAQAATITINGTPDSIPGGVGTAIEQNNVFNNTTNLPLDTQDLLVQQAAGGS
jgi:hypothetical protein